MSEFDRLVESGEVETRMRCPSCFRYGREQAIRHSAWGDYAVGWRPDPSCGYCGGRGFVPVSVTCATAAAEEQPMFEMTAG